MNNLWGKKAVKRVPDFGWWNWPIWFSDGQSADLMDAYMYNDDTGITDAEREEKLAAIFDKHGDTIRFVD